MKKLFFTSIMVVLVIVFSFGEAKAIEEGDIVLALSFDEGKGEITKDLSPLGNDGKLVNSPEWVDGKFGKALEFDGKSQKYVEVANEENFDFERTDSFTLAAWVKLAAKSAGDLNHYLIGNAEGCHAAYIGFAFYALAGEFGDTLGLQLANGTNTMVHGSTKIIDKQWHHVAGVNDGSSGGAAKGIKLYVDGKLEKMKTFLDDLGNVSILNDFPVRIGDRLLPGCGVPTNGIIDEVYIFKKALDANEINQVYRAQGLGQVLAVVQFEGRLATKWGTIKSD